jgi:HK97 family phage prohead protease
VAKQRIEHRLVPFTAFEVRTDTDGAPELVGYASVFNQEAIIEDWFDQWREEVAPGAFKKTLKEGDIRALFNHDPNIVLGRNKAGTLELAEDEHGLHTVIKPPDNEWGRPVLDAVRRGDVTGMSIGFRVIKQEWYWPPKGSLELPKRTIKEFQLFDVSPVTFPAFEQTEIAARSPFSARALPAEILQEDELLRAGALARRAQLGMELSAEERAALREAVSILSGELEEPAHSHSSGAADGEPPGGEDSARHSTEARARRLRLMRMLLVKE